MSSSHPGRRVGRASSSVTLVPRSANIEANSHPIAPPPMTATSEGRCSRARTSSEVRTKLAVDLEPGNRPGSRSGSDHDVLAVDLGGLSVTGDPDPVLRTQRCRFR